MTIKFLFILMFALAGCTHAQSPIMAELEVNQPFSREALEKFGVKCFPVMASNTHTMGQLCILADGYLRFYHETYKGRLYVARRGRDEDGKS